MNDSNATRAADTLHGLVGRLGTAAQDHDQKARHHRQMADHLCRMVGHEWADVRGVGLEPARVYVARRVWANGTRDEAGVFVWDANRGWVHVFGGEIRDTHQSGAFVEILAANDSMSGHHGPDKDTA